ncbi:AraC family transcriptional regulator [Aurantibacillus circumpalustris]|uniref:AraC family transcriptional regulator n=1 Tax=Aurantibacillus circumpalustris TaxID=3036359 RepID=UPI00295B6ADA|nr:AraC family transcriptional regulator [Aurantibacillus circumpalustris]
MINFHDFIISNSSFKKLLLNNLEFVQYDCPINIDVLPVWTQHDYIVHVISGEKKWQTEHGTTIASAGQTFYIKKGAHIIHQYYKEKFCLLLFFVKDEFKNLLQMDYSKLSPSLEKENKPVILYEIKDDPWIKNYFQSILSYFLADMSPSSSLLEIKFREFMHVLAQNKDNHAILRHLISEGGNDELKFREIMTSNYMYNLGLEDYANLCSKSLSSFKRTFEKMFGTTPGKWLLESRLQRAASLLTHSDLSITQVAFESGFEDLSHFSRSFKIRFKIAPLKYRQSP